jgi:acetyltransferase-like isoleucine patch superfamily enzyme
MKHLFRALVVLLPWFLRRHVLSGLYGYEIHPSARIGCSWIFPERLVLGPGARIGHFNVAVHLARLELGAHAILDRSNWITGFPRGGARHFAHRIDRDPALIVGAHAAITKGHHLDCTDRVTIGEFTTVAGYHSQFLTHSIDLVANRQDCAPIAVGAYCFVGTASVLLPGARLPDRSVLGAMALLNFAPAETGWLYAGVPAKPVKPLPADAAYFTRTTGWVW